MITIKHAGGWLAEHDGMSPARPMLALAAVVVAITSVAPAQVQHRSPPRTADARSGRTLAERLCLGCHLISSAAQTQPVPAGVPTFAAIAKRPGQTETAIAGGIVVPHPPMPGIPLTRSEIADLAAYVFSLREP